MHSYTISFPKTANIVSLRLYWSIYRAAPNMPEMIASIASYVIGFWKQTILSHLISLYDIYISVYLRHSRWY